MIFKAPSNKIYFILLLFIAATLPFKVMFNNLAIGLLLVYWLVTGHILEKLKTTFTDKYFLIFAAVYFIQFFGLLYSQDLADALSKLEKRAGLLVMPLLIMSSPKLSGRQIFYIVIAFAGACCLLFSYALYQVLAVYGTIIKVPQITEFIDDTIHLHHAYSGLYLVFAIIALVYYFIKYWPDLNISKKLGHFFL